MGFQDSLLVSELPDWVDMLQPVHSPSAGEAITRVDLESAPEDEGEPAEGAEPFLAA